MLLSQPPNYLTKAADLKPCVMKSTSQYPIMYGIDALSKSVQSILDYYIAKRLQLPDGVHSVGDVMKIFQKRSKTTLYPQLNNYALPGGEGNTLFKLMHEQRAGEEVWAAARQINDISSTTLLLFARKNAATPFHFDWTEAKNLALGVEVGNPPHVALMAGCLACSFPCQIGP